MKGIFNENRKRTHVLKQVAQESTFYMMLCCIFVSKIGSLKNHFHLKHEDVKELHHTYAQEKTDLLLLEKEVST